MKSEIYHKNIAKIAELRALAETRVLTEEENVDLEIALEQNEKEDHPVRAVTVPSSGNVSGRSKRNGSPFKTMGGQLQAVVRAGSAGGQTDPRLHEVRAAEGLSESIPSEGGFLIQETFGREILGEVFETGVLPKLCMSMPITSGNGIKIPGLDETSRVAGSRWGGVRGYWADEASELTKSKPKFRQLELNAHKMIALVYLTDELISDANALEAYVRKVVAAEFGFMMDDAIINGLGAGTPLGIMQAGCMVSVTKEGGQTADTIVFENITKMWSRLIGSARKNAIWLINQDCEPTLQSMKVATNFPVYVPGGGVSERPYSTLMGIPVQAIEQCATVGDTGDILLAAFDPGYVLSQKGGLQSDMSIHVQFLTDQSVLRFIMRWDGQPLLRSAITPANSTATLSHFVKLDERA